MTPKPAIYTITCGITITVLRYETCLENGEEEKKLKRQFNFIHFYEMKMRGKEL